MTNHELYVIPGCPYCKKVLDYMQEHELDMPIHDIYADEAAKERLVTVGGKVQCPCLFVNGKPMYESDDIIDYLKQNA